MNQPWCIEELHAGRALQHPEPHGIHAPAHRCGSELPQVRGGPLEHEIGH